MTAKRFKEERGIAKFIDNQTGKEYSEYNLDEIVCLLNELHEQNQYLKSLKWNQDCINEISISMQQIQLLEKENEQLKTIIDQLRTDNTKQKKKLNTTMKENEQLKHQIHYLKIVCRNELDDETLKQVMGSLGDLE